MTRKCKCRAETNGASEYAVIQWDALEDSIEESAVLLASFLSMTDEQRSIFAREHLGEGYLVDFTSRELISDFLTSRVNRISETFSRCEACGQIAFFEDEGEYTYYTRQPSPREARAEPNSDATSPSSSDDA